MVRVLAAGTFDIIHLGHIKYLEEAKSMGDELIVVVAHDNTVRKKKHEPIMPQEVRRRIVESLKPVDKAVNGNDGDILEIVKKIKPDIIALGYDQDFDENELKRKLKEMGMDVKVVRCHKYAEGDLNGTRRIIRRIADKLASKKLYGGKLYEDSGDS